MPYKAITQKNFKQSRIFLFFITPEVKLLNNRELDVEKLSNKNL